MSPHRTFHSCSSSSSEVWRRKRQKRLISRSSATLQRVADSCSSTGRWVRNFSRVKGRPSLPMRSCRKTTPGPVGEPQDQRAQQQQRADQQQQGAGDRRRPAARLPRLPRRRAPMSSRRQANPASCVAARVRRGVGVDLPHRAARLRQRPQQRARALRTAGWTHEDGPDAVLDEGPLHLLDRWSAPAGPRRRPGGRRRSPTGSDPAPGMAQHGRGHPLRGRRRGR